MSEPMYAQEKDEATVQSLATPEVAWSVVRSGLVETSKVDQDVGEKEHYKPSIAGLVRNWKM